MSGVSKKFKLNNTNPASNYLLLTHNFHDNTEFILLVRESVENSHQVASVGL